MNFISNHSACYEDGNVGGLSPSINGDILFKTALWGQCCGLFY